MSQHLPRIFDGAINALRDHVLPAVGDEVRRGQLVAVLTTLSELKLKTEWSRDWLLQQVEAQAATFCDIVELLGRMSVDWLATAVLFRGQDDAWCRTRSPAR